MKQFNKEYFIRLLLLIFSLLIFYSIACYLYKIFFKKNNIIEANTNSDDLKLLKNKVYKNTDSIATLNAGFNNIKNINKKIDNLDNISKGNQKSIKELHKSFDAKNNK